MGDYRVLAASCWLPANSISCWLHMRTQRIDRAKSPAAPAKNLQESLLFSFRETGTQFVFLGSNQIEQPRTYCASWGMSCVNDSHGCRKTDAKRTYYTGKLIRQYQASRKTDNSRKRFLARDLRPGQTSVLSPDAVLLEPTMKQATRTKHQ